MPVVSSVVVAIGATVLGRQLQAHAVATNLFYLFPFYGPPDVYGMAYYWNVEINFIVAIFLLIAIGLSVDYSAHIGHAFKEAHGTATERAFTAIKVTGPPVFNAIFSTFVAVLVLVNAKTYVFVVFFQMFTLTTLLGGFHGLVFLPVVLSMVGGMHPHPNTAESKSLKAAHPDKLTEIELMRRSGIKGSDSDDAYGETKKVFNVALETSQGVSSPVRILR